MFEIESSDRLTAPLPNPLLQNDVKPFWVVRTSAVVITIEALAYVIIDIQHWYFVFETTGAFRIRVDSQQYLG